MLEQEPVDTALMLLHELAKGLVVTDPRRRKQEQVVCMGVGDCELRQRSVITAHDALAVALGFPSRGNTGTAPY